MKKRWLLMIVFSLFLCGNVSATNTKSNVAHVVKKGDTLYSLAKRYGTTVTNIKQMNHLRSNLIIKGRTLLVPKLVSKPNLSVNTIAYTVKKGDTLYSIGKSYEVSVENIKKENKLKNNTIKNNQKLYIPYNSQKFQKYIVKKGDTLSSIAKKQKTTVERLKKMNRLTSLNIKANQQLLIPKITEIKIPEKEQPEKNVMYKTKAGKQLCIFYGWTTYVNDASGDMNKAIAEYKNCDVLVLGAGLQDVTHPEHQNTISIITALKQQKPTLQTYGYINIGISTTNTSIATLKQHILEWKSMGITGIFVDEAGYDFGVTRERQLEVMDFIHQNGLTVFANAWFMNDILSPVDENGRQAALPLKKEDWILFENLFSHESTFYPESFKRLSDAKQQIKEQGLHVAGVATTKQPNECEPQKTLMQYALLGSYLFDVEAFQCADNSFGSDSAMIMWNQSSIEGLNQKTEWVSSSPKLVNQKWVRETKDAKYIFDTTTFAFSKESK